jgi:hypothetical protein
MLPASHPSMKPESNTPNQKLHPSLPHPRNPRHPFKSALNKKEELA